MGEEQGPDFYDQNLAPTMAELLRNPWLPIWLLAAQWIEADPPERIIDLGCGYGRFAELLYRRGYRGSYHGVDFAPRTITAASRNEALHNGKVSWEVADIRDYEVPEAASRELAVVCLETLEHVSDDLGVIERLPAGNRVLFSVPNFDSIAHLRYMDERPAYNRYGPLVEYRRLGKVDLSPPTGRYVSMFEGWRR